MSEWKPIDTAPKDGTKVDVWVHFGPDVGSRYTDAWWSDAWDGWQLDRYNERQYSDHPTVTHWMPIPPPPIQQQKGT